MSTFLFMYREEDRRTTRSMIMTTKVTTIVKNTRKLFIFIFEDKIGQLVSPLYFLNLSIEEKVVGGPP